MKGASVAYVLGPERMKPTEEKTVPVPAEGLVVRAKGMDQPGFLRLVATASVDGREYRGLATAGYAPEQIKPTVPEPSDFDAFWDTNKKALAGVPMDAKLTPMPASSTAKADCWHVSLQNVALEAGHLTHVYGVLCEPKGDGPFPRCSTCRGRESGPIGATSRWPSAGSSRSRSASTASRSTSRARSTTTCAGARCPAIASTASTTVTTTTTAASTWAACGRATSS